MSAALAILMFAVVAVAAPAGAQDIALELESIDPYLLDEAYEIALARSAAPEPVAAGATVMVLRRDGHVIVEPGINGFTCLVERSWSSPIGPHQDFFNPELRAPICYNAEASRTILNDYLRRTELALAGEDVRAIYETIKIEIGQGKLRAPRALAMSYMFSGGQILGTEAGRFRPHVMIYVPYATAEDLGELAPGVNQPVMFEHAGGPLAALLIPVAEFNPAPALPMR